MTQFVLVHGAWHGGWCWARVLPLLRAPGHAAHAVTLTGVADALRRQCPGLLRHLVYVDAVVPLLGESWSGTHAPEVVAGRVAAAQRSSGGLSLPAPDAEAFGLKGSDRDWVNRRQTPQPFAVYRDPLEFDAGRIAALPRIFFDCTSPEAANIAISRKRARTQPGWRVFELATGHDPRVSAPPEFARIPLDCAG